MTCAATVNDVFRCPRKWELWRQVMSLLPRGRAWQTHEDGAERIVASESSQAGAYELGSTGLGTEPVVERLTVMQLYWAAYAEVLEFLHQRACALIEECFCATATELRAEWGVEYGFPDECAPWDTLCDKVRAQGGATCAYLASLAARIGWVVECAECSTTGNDRADRMIADCNAPCGCEQNVIYIRIYFDQSPAAGAGKRPMLADRMMADCHDACEPDTSAVQCLIERWKPAHVKAIYEIIGGSV